jgi:hypothetical protein
VLGDNRALGSQRREDPFDSRAQCRRMGLMAGRK